MTGVVCGPWRVSDEVSGAQLVAEAKGHQAN